MRPRACKASPVKPQACGWAGRSPCATSVEPVSAEKMTKVATPSNSLAVKRQGRWKASRERGGASLSTRGSGGAPTARPPPPRGVLSRPAAQSHRVRHTDAPEASEPCQGGATKRTLREGTLAEMGAAKGRRLAMLRGRLTRLRLQCHVARHRRGLRRAPPRLPRAQRDESEVEGGRQHLQSVVSSEQ